jgi:tRNA(Ile)-lysidine synthase
MRGILIWYQGSSHKRDIVGSNPTPRTSSKMKSTNLIYKSSLIKAETLDVAVSMGMDSFVMMNFLANGSRNLRLHYVNHGTEYASKAEKNFRDYVSFLKFKGEKYGRPPIKIEGFVWGDPTKNSMSKEAEFRDFRYGLFDYFFSDKKDTTNQLIVCHHLDDAVESYLMNAFTSASYDRKLPETTDRGTYEVIRPFLMTPKTSILSYYEEKIYAEDKKYLTVDPSNDDTSFKRNFVRLELLPKIKEQYPGIDKVVRKLYINNEKSSSKENRPSKEEEIYDTIP